MPPAMRFSNNKVGQEYPRTTSAAGKRPGRATGVNTVTVGAINNDVHTTPLLHVQDATTGVKFLVDTGAEVSIVLPKPEDLRKHPQPNRSLVAANGSPIDTYGVKKLVLSINRANFTWTFRIAKAYVCILGADFMRAHALVPDLVNKRLICLKNLKVLQGLLMPAQRVKITAISIQDEFTTILRNRPALITPKFAPKKPKHTVKHYIITKGPPIKSKARRLNPEKLVIAKEEFDTMVNGSGWAFAPPQ